MNSYHWPAAVPAYDDDDDDNDEDDDDDNDDDIITPCMFIAFIRSLCCSVSELQTSKIPSVFFCVTFCLQFLTQHKGYIGPDFNWLLDMRQDPEGQDDLALRRIMKNGDNVAVVTWSDDFRTKSAMVWLLVPKGYYF